MNTATLISNKRTHFDTAIAEDIGVKRDENIFSASKVNGKKQIYKQPDADFYRAISMDEFRKLVKEDIHQIYSSKK